MAWKTNTFSKLRLKSRRPRQFYKSEEYVCTSKNKIFGNQSGFLGLRWIQEEERRRMNLGRKGRIRRIVRKRLRGTTLKCKFFGSCLTLSFSALELCISFIQLNITITLLWLFNISPVDAAFELTIGAQQTPALQQYPVFTQSAMSSVLQCTVYTVHCTLPYQHKREHLSKHGNYLYWGEQEGELVHLPFKRLSQLCNSTQKLFQCFCSFIIEECCEPYSKYIE